MAEDEDRLEVATDLAPPTETRADLAMRARIAARLQLDVGVGLDGGAAIQQIGRYEVVRRIGAGGMGVVYEARDPRLDRTVAAKLLRPHRQAEREDPHGNERLHREARALAKLSHPNVVQIHEVGEDRDLTFVVMELVRGRTLHEWQRRERPKLSDIVAAYRQAGLGLAAAHEAGLVHRDFKPSNALIGDDGRVRVVDFGLARGPIEVAQTMTAPSHEGSSPTGVAGTPGYIAPEILAGDAADARGDQFSFCVALWEAVEGERPIARRRRAGSKPSFSGPAWLRRVLERGLAENSEDRWPDMATLIRALDRRPRRQLWLGIGLPLLGLAAGLVIEPLLAESRDPCAALAREFDRVWNPAAADQLRARLAALGRTDAEIELVIRDLDRQRARWLDAERRACEAIHVTASWSPQLAERASRCLADNLEQARTLIGLFDPASEERPTSVRAVLAQLEDPRECADLDNLARQSSALGSEAIVGLRQSIDRTRMLLAGEMLVGDGESERLLARARELHGAHLDDPLAEWVLAEALALRAEAEQWRQRPDLAWPLLREAMPLARRSGDAALELRCLHRLAYLAAAQLEQPERAADLAAIAAGVVPLVEPAARANFEHALVRAALARAKQRYAEAESILAVAIAGAPEGLILDEARLRLANVIAEQGRLDDALAIYVELATVLREQVGERSVELGLVEFNIGLTLHELGTDEEHAREAERHLREALAILERSLGPDSVRLSPILTVLAELEVIEERLDDALRHAERAWALQQDQLPREHGDYGQALKVIAYANSRSGNYQAALTTYELMLEILDVDTSDEEAELAYIIGWTKCRLNRCSEARASFEDAGERTSSGQIRVYASVGLANADIADGQPAAAVERLGRLRPIIDTEFADDAELGAESSWLMARALVDAGGDRAEARGYLRRALDGYAELQRVAPDIAADLERLAAVLGG